MKRFHRLGITTFTSITNVFMVPVSKGISSVKISASTGDFLDGLIDRFIKDEAINDTNKICKYMNIKLDEDTYEKAIDLTIQDTLLEMEYRGQVHAEISLVCFLLENSMNHGEIGTSKLCCAPCCMFIEMLARRNLAEFSKSGSHGKVYPSWIFPVPKSVFKDDFELIVEDITTMIFAYHIKKSITNQSGDTQMDAEIDSEIYVSDTELGDKIVS
jgi:hypothetical protein